MESNNSEYSNEQNKEYKNIEKSEKNVQNLNISNFIPITFFCTLDTHKFTKDKTKPIEKDGLTYEYMSTGNGILSTTHVVSQNWSWWSIPVLVAEIATIVYSGYQIGKSIKDGIAASAANAAQQGGQAMAESQVTAFTNAVTNLAQNGVGNATAEQCAALAGVNLNTLNISNWTIYNLYGQGICTCDGIMNTFTPAMLQNGYRHFLSYMTPQMLADGFATLANELATVTISSFGGLKLSGITTLNIGTGLMAARMLGEDYNGDNFHAGLVAQNRSYIHSASLTGVGLNMIYTPSKNMVYHQYISKADPNLRTANIYAGADDDTRTMTFRRSVFAGNKNLVDVRFHETKGSTTKESVSMTIAIPDSAFAGCTSLEHFDLRFYTGGNPSQSLGPENFILCGDSIFAGCDSTKLKIIIPKDRKQDFLDDAMWSKYKRFFTYEETEYPGGIDDFGVQYVYAYEGNTTKKVSMRNGHKVEHLVAWGADDSWLLDHKGELGLFNDIGIYNSYKLDYVRKGAFRGNKELKSVSCWDINIGGVDNNGGRTLFFLNGIVGEAIIPGARNGLALADQGNGREFCALRNGKIGKRKFAIRSYMAEVDFYIVGQGGVGI